MQQGWVKQHCFHAVIQYGRIENRSNEYRLTILNFRNAAHAIGVMVRIRQGDERWR
jgi:hypothetical protein